jgi:hypothetical protein
VFVRVLGALGFGVPKFHLNLCPWVKAQSALAVTENGYDITFAIFDAIKIVTNFGCKNLGHDLLYLILAKGKKFLAMLRLVCRLMLLFHGNKWQFMANTLCNYLI